MEQWEHVLVRLRHTPIRQVTVTPTQMELEAEDLSTSIDGVIRVVNQLGVRGWQLVSAEGGAGDGEDGTYWLKRPRR